MQRFLETFSDKCCLFVEVPDAHARVLNNSLQLILKKAALLILIWGGVTAKILVACVPRGT